MKFLFLGLFRGLKSFFWFVARIFGKRPKYRTNKLTKKQRAYVWNFSPGRLKNVTHKKTDKKSKKLKKQKLEKFSKNT